MKLFILGFYLVLVLAYLEDGNANRTRGQRKAANTGGKSTKYLNSRSRPMKTTATKSTKFSHVSLPKKSYSRKPQVSQPRLDKVQSDPKKVSKPGQGKKASKQTNKRTTKNKQKVANIKASLRKMFGNKKSSITDTKKQKGKVKLPALKKKTKKTTQNIKAALNKYLKNKKSNKPTTNLKNTKTNSHSSTASALRSFVTKQKGVNTGSSNKPRKLPRRICKRSTSGSDCKMPDLNDDKKTPVSPLEKKAAHIKYLRNENIKFNEADLIGTVEKHGDDSGPDVIFLEKGNKDAGLIHILEGNTKKDGHRGQFITKFGLQGSNNEEIDSQIEKIILKTAATKSVKTKIEYKIDDDGKKQPSKISLFKEVEWNGETKRMKIGIGTNGYIVTAYPVSSKKVKDAPDTDIKTGNTGTMSKRELKRIEKKKLNKLRKALKKAEKEAETVIPHPNAGAGAA